MYPALAVLQGLRSKEQASVKSPQEALQRCSVLWVGSVGGMEVELVELAKIEFDAIPAAGVHGVGLRALPGNLLQLWRGFWEARRILRRFRPHVLFFTGGYVAVPMALAGWRVPTVLYVPDIEPGMALKFLSRFADRIALTAPDSGVYYLSRPQLKVTGYPVRADLQFWSLDEARRALGLSPDLPTLLVFGGSKGARSINRALLAVLPQLLGDMQVVHVSGRLDWPDVQKSRDALVSDHDMAPEIVARYHAYPYLHAEMGAALTAADLAVARAGASTLGEFPIFGLPAILVPYPHAWRYQMVNARYLESHGAALILEDAALGEDLFATIKTLMDDPSRRTQMKQAMHSLAKPDAAQSIASMLGELALATSPERI